MERNDYISHILSGAFYALFYFIFLVDYFKTFWVLQFDHCSLFLKYSGNLGI